MLTIAGDTMEITIMRVIIVALTTAVVTHDDKESSGSGSTVRIFYVWILLLGKVIYRIVRI